MRSKEYDLDISKNQIIISESNDGSNFIYMDASCHDTRRASSTDKFGTDQLYSTADEDDDASALFLNNEDTEDDENFLKTSHVCVLLYCQIFSRPILHKPFWLLITIKR
jgi:hypothetical protein